MNEGIGRKNAEKMKQPLISAGGIATSQSPAFTLPMRYMLLGIVGFGLFAIDLVTQAHTLAVGSPGLPALVALTHLLVLGSLLSFVIGAVYQLSTVAFLVPVRVVPLAKVNFWLYLVSFIGLWVTMQNWIQFGFILFGSLMVLAVSLYSLIILWSLATTKVRGAMTWFIASAHIYLLLAITFALLLAFADGGIAPVLVPLIDRLVATHILFAVGGFFTFLIIGFSFKLLPMFTLSHGFSTWREQVTHGCMHAGIWLIVAGLWIVVPELTWLGVVFGLIGFVNHMLYLRGIFQKRMRKRIELPMKSVFASIGFGVLGFILLFVQLVWIRQRAVLETFVLFYLLGFITLTVMSFSFKIVPFLIWSERYGSRIGKEKVPLMGELLPLARTRKVYGGYITGVLVTSLSLAWRFVPLVQVGSVLTALSLLIYCIELVYVIRPKQVAVELRHKWQD